MALVLFPSGLIPKLLTENPVHVFTCENVINLIFLASSRKLCITYPRGKKMTWGEIMSTLIKAMNVSLWKRLAVSSVLGPVLNAYLGPYLYSIHNGWKWKFKFKMGMVLHTLVLGGVDLEMLTEISRQGSRGCMKGFALNRRSVQSGLTVTHWWLMLIRSRERLDAAVCCNLCT